MTLFEKLTLRLLLFIATCVFLSRSRDWSEKQQKQASETQEMLAKCVLEHTNLVQP